MSLYLYDPSQRESGGFSVRANVGDVCVAYLPSGYYVGSVSAVDAGGMATQIMVGNAPLNVAAFTKGIEPIGNFDANVRQAFGHFRSMAEVEQHLRPHYTGVGK